MAGKKVGLALGGGALKGLAHIGVLRVLEDNKIPIDLISGTSIGALIGALYSFEPNAKKLEKEALEEDIGSLFDYTIPTRGLIKGDKIEEFLKKKLGDIEFSDLKIPLYITSFDLDKKREVIFSKGNVVKAVRASISVPGVFVPVENKGDILVDGGIVDPIPTEVLRKKGAEVLIAVNVINIREHPVLYDEVAVKESYKRKIPSIIETFMKSMAVVGAEEAKSDIKKSSADLIINVFLEDIGWFDYKKSKEIIEKGKRTTRALLKEIKKTLTPHPFKDFLDELNKSFSDSFINKKN